MKLDLRAISVLPLLLLLSCLDPSDRRPGTWLTGEVVPADQLPTDWSFTDGTKEIAIEVATPYLIPHSVTIWCASLDGALYVGARDPETKRWPAWVDANPNVRLGIAGKLYDVQLTPQDEVADAATLARLRAVYATKYALPEVAADAPPGSVPPTRYWRIGPHG